MKDLLFDENTVEEILKKIAPSPIEDQVEVLIECMRHCLNQDERPNLGMFWGVKKEVLLLFKQPMNQIKRNAYWDSCKELSHHAYTLQKHLDQKSALQKELFLEIIEQLRKDSVEVEGVKSALSSKEHRQSQRLRDIDLKSASFWDAVERYRVYNQLAKRCQAVREEIHQLSGRFKEKKILLETLSKTGDQIFPNRYTQQERIIQELATALHHFSSKYYDEKRGCRIASGASPFRLASELKTLQSLIKELSLPQNMLSDLKAKLKKLWEATRIAIEESKAQEVIEFERSEKKYALLEDRIGGLKLDLAKEAFEKMAMELRGEVKRAELAKEHRDSLFKVIEEKERSYWQRVTSKIEAENRQAEKMRRRREEGVATLREDLLTQCSEDLSEIDAEETLERIREISKRYHPHLSKIEEEVVALQAFFDLYGLLISHLERVEADASRVHSARKKYRDEVKSSCERLKRATGVCGFDLDRLFYYDQLLQHEKDRLAAINKALNV